MTEEVRTRANELAQQIKDIKEDITTCKVMLENHHDKITIRSNLFFGLPSETADVVLRLSFDALQKKLDRLEKEYSEL